ncbi:MAG: Aminopeptidase (Arg, Lys, Leu preference) [Acidimicrobiales bacterium]|jgi:putative cell wall-binding protein|nr:Aminopeptidase (Arg, Lys, Leu preference) [Acidimicrobiales bacterium]
MQTVALGYRRSLGVVAVLVATLALHTLVRTPAQGAATVQSGRIGGSDRYETARLVAEQAFASGAPFAVLARGDAFPDALAGSYLAGAAAAGGGKRGPVLLTTGDHLSPSASTAINNLHIGGVLVLGGVSAISDDVLVQLDTMKVQHKRIGGATRYDTAKAVAEALGSDAVGKLDGDRTAIVATGANFADALSSGPISFVDGFPTILTSPGSLAPQASQALRDLHIVHVLIVGGPAAVSTAVEAEIKALGITKIDRFAGRDRQDTAQQIASFELAKLGFGATHVNLARGDDFPDGLAGGPHAGMDSHASGAPILLTDTPTDLGSAARAYLASHDAAITSVDGLGGPAALSQSVLDEATGIATCQSMAMTSSTSSSSSSSTTSTTANSASTIDGNKPCTAPTSTTGGSSSTGTATSSSSTTPATSPTTTAALLPCPFPGTIPCNP